MTKYWFNLASETFLWTSNVKVLLYNTSCQKSLILKNNTNQNTILSQFWNLENLYCIELSESDLKDNDISTFVKEVVKAGFGNIVVAEKGKRKPVFLVPELKLQKKMKKTDLFLETNENMLQYLHEVDIYVNDGQHYNQQFSKKEVDLKNISYPNLLQFLNTFINKSSVNTINILGDYPLEYPYIESLMELLHKTKTSMTLSLRLSQVLDNEKKLSALTSFLRQINIIVEPKFGLNNIFNVINLTKSIKISTAWKFKISSVKEYNKVENIINSKEIENYEILPFFNGFNIDFFEEYVYLTEDNILNTPLTKREIFARQVINTNYFGKLIIKSDGLVYTNLHQTALGTINNTSNELVCKELNGSSSWLKIRDKEPCSNCVYRWLCPSPSDYELELNKPNMCHIRL